MKTVYLDSVLVCEIYSNDQKQEESAAFEAVMDSHSAGQLQLVTSQVTKDEIDQCPEEWKKMHMKAYRLLTKVRYIPAQEHKGYASQSDQFGFTSWPIMDGHPTWVRLREIGLDEKDAHHVTLAIENQCDWFLTCDKRTILARRAEIEKAFPAIKLMLPSELMSSNLLDGL